MTDFAITTAFDDIYHSTYRTTLAYVTKKCGNADDIADILQETYAEIYIVLIHKGLDYLQNVDAFVLQVAKTKIHRHYSLAARLKNMVPLVLWNEDGDEIDNPDITWNDPQIEDQWIDHLLLDDIAKWIAAKSSEVQKVFYLFYFFDMSIPQIALALGIKKSTVKNRIYRTVREIRKFYERDG